MKLFILLIASVLFISGGWADELSSGDSSSAHPPYKRTYFEHWIDEDNDCQDTRVEKLADTNLSEDKLVSANFCHLDVGLWYDPYGGAMWSRSTDLDLDHIVPLKYAWEHGAWQWENARRRAFANDPENLILVRNRLNRQKGAKGPEQWLPPRESYRCEYIFRFLTVLAKYSLDWGDAWQAVAQCEKKTSSNELVKE